MGDLLLPVGVRRNTSWATHQRRNPKSSEPGTDFFCDIGTPVLAPADGYIYGYGLTIGPPTGRWCGINFDNGMSFRGLHMSEVWARSGRVRRGQQIGLSGATGYGEEDWSWNVAETGGAHLHATLWPTHNQVYGYDRNGRPYTIDIMQHIGGITASVSATGIDVSVPVKKKEDDIMRLIKAQDRGTALVAGGYYKSLTPDQEVAWSKIIDPAKELTPGEFDQIRASSVWGDLDYTSAATVSASSVDAIAERVAQIVKG